LKQHFSEREIVELTWLNAVGNYLNLQAKPLGLGSEGFCSVPTGNIGAGDGKRARARTDMDKAS
ncbi:MAG: hypothetical protein O7F08_03830, partial [Deltaproteobacteria bacterium]|nr:hypothetical protein [Deltaproteobacteria bacterium]